MVHRRLIYIYLLNVLSFSYRYFNKIKRTSRLGRLLALSLEILCRLPIAFANGLNPDDNQQNVGLDLDPNCLTLMVALGVLFLKT